MTTCNWFVLIEPQPHDTWWYKWYKSLWMCPNYACRSSTDLLSLHLISQILKTFRPHAIHRVAVRASPWWLPLVLPLGPLPTLPRSLPPSRCSFHRHLSTRDEKGLIKTTRNFARVGEVFLERNPGFFGELAFVFFLQAFMSSIGRTTPNQISPLDRGGGVTSQCAESKIFTESKHWYHNNDWRRHQSLWWGLVSRFATFFLCDKIEICRVTNIV